MPPGRSKVPVVLALTVCLCASRALANPVVEKATKTEPDPTSESDKSESDKSESDGQAALSVVTPASPEAVEAARLFAEAQVLYDAGRYEQACIKFENSLAKKPGIGIRFNLADCWQRIGRTASAHALFLEVAEATKELGQSEREAVARERAAVLAPALSRLQIQLSEDVSGLEVRRDGVKLDRNSLGVPFPVDPGNHEISLSAPGKKPWSTKISVPSEPATITALVVPPLAEVEKVPARPPETNTTPEAGEPQSTASGPDPTRRTISLVLAGFGVVGVALGGAMGAQYFGSQQDAEAVCPSSRNCSPDDVSLHETLVEDARTARTWAYVGVGAGGAALLAATLLYFTGDSDESRPSTGLRASPWVAHGGLGTSLTGDF